MSCPIFYPPCRWLDPNNRNAAGHFYCEHRGLHVIPQESVYRKARSNWRGSFSRSGFERDACAPDCFHRSGKTRRATL